MTGIPDGGVAAPTQRTVAELRASARGRLADAGVASPDVDARLLLAHALRLDPSDLAVRAREPVAAACAAAANALVERRAARVPLQLLLGRWTFRHVELEVVAGVFVPRPETEVLAGLAVAAAPAGGRVVEVCTGSGAVAAALADERPDLTVVATDVDPRAVAVARRNAPSVDVRCGDLLDPVDPGWRGAVDVLVANPPYLAEHEIADLPPEVADHDPRAALVAGPTGAEISDRLLALARDWLAPGGTLLLEVDERRAAQCADRAAAAGLCDATCVVDLANRPRFVRATRPPSASPGSLPGSGQGAG